MTENKIYWNDHWYYKPNLEEAEVEVRIPHTNIELPLHYFDEQMYQFISYYRKTFTPEETWRGKHLLLTFEGVAHVAKVYIGEKMITEHWGGYTAFTVDIASYITYGVENEVRVEVDSRESLNLPPFGNVVDYLTYGGIYRDVYLEVKERIYIEDVYVKTSHVLEREKQLDIDITIHNDMVQETLQDYKIMVFTRRYGAVDWNLHHQEPLSEVKTTVTSKLLEVDLWDIDQPNLYEVNVEIWNHSTTQNKLDQKIIRFGFRECEFRTDGFFLNNKPIKIRGLNRHQAYPYVGYAMPKRPQQLDADILKVELGVNAVRTSHYPQSQYFLDRCDELGLLVFTEITGWQHIGDEAWQNLAVENAKEMVLQYRNHPSIILWGARVNESQDNDEFYARTNGVIHELDETRQTGGVRFIKKSHLLEDVYTYNDFSHTGENAGVEPKVAVTSQKNKPYLVAEYNGHMFPTKAFDCESHRLEHAKRHANVLEGIYQNEDIAGGFGWCMFDYNTHKDFGSGDKVCYHGVMNMFRVQKLAASVYASQNSENDVLEISSTMDIGEHPGGNLGEVYAFTNADQVKLYKNGEFVKSFYPNEKAYGHLPHPPILIDDFIGGLMEEKEGYSHKNAEVIKEVMRAIVKYGQNNLPLKYKLKMAKVMISEHLTMEDGMRLYYEYVGNWGGEATSYTFKSIRNDAVAKIVTKQAMKKVDLKVNVDTNQLIDGDTYDVASIRIQVVDECDQVLPYYQSALQFSVDGEIALIGPQVVTAIGGATGTYVKSIGLEGNGTLYIRGENLDTVQIPFTIQKK